LSTGTPGGKEANVLIDCDRCEVRGRACGDCVVAVLLGGPPDELSAAPDPVELDAASRDAIEILADSGLIPPLRLVLAPGPEAARSGESSWDTPRERRSAAG
jgi:hypothetical protein